MIVGSLSREGLLAMLGGAWAAAWQVAVGAGDGGHSLKCPSRDLPEAFGTCILQCALHWKPRVPDPDAA